MKRRMFLYTMAILLAGLAGFFAVSFHIVRGNSLRMAENRLVEMTHIYAGLLTDNVNLTDFVNIGGESRVTVVSAGGYVLADSRPTEGFAGENRLNRPEIQAAAAGAPAVFIRRSNTLGVDYIYYALQVETAVGAVFVRVSTSVAEVDAYLAQSLPLLTALFFALALAGFFLVGGMTNQIIKPFSAIEQKLRRLAAGEYAQAPQEAEKPAKPVKTYEEIKNITRGIDGIAAALQDSLDALRREKDKLAYILDNIGDGLFVVDGEGRVALANATAQGIFNVTADIVGKDLSHLTGKKKLAAAVKSCVDGGKEALLELRLQESIFLVAVRRLPDTKLTMAALTNVTENRENAKRREEFFTNASHELKTPLTAIKGFNELLTLNNKDENMSKYIDGIARETGRLMSLIAHMLKLSELENAAPAEPAPISLAGVIEEVGQTMSAALAEKGIRLETQGGGTVMADPEHVYELVKNLVENAVKYNHPGGKVSVTVTHRKKRTLLTVADSGIGISPKDQARIFERFYRVDKSRAVSRGGTGLGLSIVKHICVLYGWKLSLKSKLGVGTEVVVEFLPDGNTP